MAEIARIHQPAPDGEVIKKLEAALDRARAGETHGVLLLEQDKAGCKYVCAGLKNRFELIGFLSHAIHQLQAD